MRATPTPAADLRVDDIIDLESALVWLRSHADGPIDGLPLAVGLAGCDFATITAREDETHCRTGEPVAVIRNTIYDIAIPATLPILRITA